MMLFQHVVRRGFLTPVLGVICGLAATVVISARIISGEYPHVTNNEKKDLLEATPPVSKTPVNATPEKPLNKAMAMTTALVNPIKPAVIIKPKTAAEKPAGVISIVRRASFIAFKGLEFQIYTGKYRCMLDFFDTYYFHYLGDGATDKGRQWFKFRAKNRTTDKAEIRFKLIDSRFSRLIYQIMIVETFEHFLPGNSPLEEEEGD